ncbi:MAG: hypothetical protein ACE5LU_11660 [Anaerolineae bacterium]
MPPERDLIQRIQSQVSRLVQAVADAEFWHDRWLEQAEEEHQRQVAAAEARYHQVIAEAQSTYGHQESAGLLSAPWHDPRWESWVPATGGVIPPFILAGQLIEAGQWHRLTIPAIFPLAGGYNVLFKAVGGARTTAVQAIQSVMLRLVAMTSPGKLRFTLIDPVGLGQNVAPFMHLADYNEALVTSRAWTEPHHIEQRLADLTEHMETVIQTYLRNQYATIEEYNVQAGEIAEPYRVLAVLNFPVNFSDEAARRLVSIAQNGPRCGIYTLITVDTEQRLPHGFNLADLERTAIVIAWDEERFVWEDDDFRDCILELDTPPDAKRFDHILSAVGEAAEQAGRVEVPFERVAPQPAQWWTEDSGDGLRVPLGPVGARRL